MKKILALTLALALSLGLCACGGGSAEEAPAEETTTESTEIASGVEDGILTVAMECNYAPYNWTQPDDSNGAVQL